MTRATTRTDLPAVGQVARRAVTSRRATKTHLIDPARSGPLVLHPSRPTMVGRALCNRAPLWHYPTRPIDAEALPLCPDCEARNR